MSHEQQEQAQTRAQEKLSRCESVEVARSHGESASGEALPQGWAEATGDDLFEFVRGVTYNKSDLLAAESSDSVAVLRAGNLQDSRLVFDDLVHVPPANIRDEQRLKNGDLVIAMSSGSAKIVGKVAIVNEDMPRVAFGAFCGLMRPRTEEIRHWLGQYFQTLDYRNFISQIAAGININNLRRQHLQELAIVVPPTQEMNRLNSAIESLQERSSRARVLLSEVGPLIGQLRQSVLRDAFSGKLTAHWRAKQNSSLREPTPLAAGVPSKKGGAGAEPEVENRELPGQDRLGRRSAKGRLASGGSPESPGATYEPASALLHRIRTERKNRWEAEQLALYETKGKQPPKNWQDKYQEPEPVTEEELELMHDQTLPEGWQWAPAELIVEPEAEIVYGIVQPGKKLEVGIPYVRGMDIIDGVIQVEQLLKTSEKIAAKYERASLKEGDILLGIIRATKVAIVPDSLNGANITQGTARFRPSSIIRTRFLAGWLESPDAQNWLHAHYRGIDMPGLNLRDVRRLPVPIAPLDEQEAVEQIVENGIGSVLLVRDTIASMESSLTQLDQSILSKAFRGELVPQDPRDEPASELLARIRTTREQADDGKAAAKNISQRSKKKSKPAKKTGTT